MLLGLAVLSISAPKPDSLGMTKGMPFGAALAEVRRALAGVPREPRLPRLNGSSSGITEPFCSSCTPPHAA